MEYWFFKEKSDRRKGPDRWSKILNWLSWTSWGLLLAILLIFEQARPRVSTFYDRRSNITVRTFWDEGARRALLFTFVLSLGISLYGLYLNHDRLRREKDHYRVSLILLGIVSAIGLIFFML